MKEILQRYIVGDAKIDINWFHILHVPYILVHNKIDTIYIQKYTESNTKENLGTIKDMIFLPLPMIVNYKLANIRYVRIRWLINSTMYIYFYLGSYPKENFSDIW